LFCSGDDSRGSVKNSFLADNDLFSCHGVQLFQRDTTEKARPLSRAFCVSGVLESFCPLFLKERFLMDPRVKDEIGIIVDAIISAAERHPKAKEPFQFGSDLSADVYENGTEIAQAIENSFPHAQLFAAVNVETHPTSLSFNVFYPPFYLTDSKDGRWFVDAPFEDCWYFEASDEKSAKELAAFFNSPPNANKLRHLRHNIGIDEASLKLWLLGIRDQGISVTAFAHKGTGDFTKNNLLD
jgi:hypothetical protein